jgi:hypothetical protein
MNTVAATRLATLVGNRSSDCASLTAAELSSGGFTITQDPDSYARPDPAPTVVVNGPTTPAAGSGYVYIYPAVATNATGTCTGAARASGGTVTIQIEVKFSTVTPYMNRFLNNLIITSISTQPTQY